MLSIGHLEEEFAGITEYFAPRVTFFLVHRGTFILRYRDGSEAVLKPGDFHVVPRGVEHFPYAPEETWIVFVEPASTTHAGDTPSPLAKTVEAQLAHLRGE